MIEHNHDGETPVFSLKLTGEFLDGYDAGLQHAARIVQAQGIQDYATQCLLDEIERKILACTPPSPNF